MRKMTRNLIVAFVLAAVAFTQASARPFPASVSNNDVSIFLPFLSNYDTSVSGTIALLLPGGIASRYDTRDRPAFEAKFKELCPNCQIIYSDANQDAATQLAQAEAALTNGAQVLVLDPVDSAAAGSIADKAKAAGVPVIAYDRLILNSDGVNYYTSFDNEEVGKQQAQSLVDKLNQMSVSNPTIVMINGSPTDNNAGLFKAGAHSVFDPLVSASKLAIGKEYDPPTGALTRHRTRCSKP